MILKMSECYNSVAICRNESINFRIQEVALHNRLVYNTVRKQHLMRRFSEKPEKFPKGNKQRTMQEVFKAIQAGSDKG